MEKEYFECRCHTPDHLIKFSLDEEDGMVGMYIQLNHYKNFFQRLWTAFKYLFKVKSNDTHWDNFILHENDIDRLIDFLQRAKQIQQNK